MMRLNLKITSSDPTLSGLENYSQIFKGLIRGGSCGRGKIFAISI